LLSLENEKLTSLILVDNSACNEENLKLESIAKEIKLTNFVFPVTKIYNKKNLGFGKAVNCAISADRAATGGHDYYLLINNDAEATQGLVSGLMQAAAQDPSLALIAPRIRWGGKDLDYYWYQPMLGMVSRTPLLGSFAYLSGCCLLIDANILDVNGKLFDEDFFMYGEDVELTARVIRDGRRIACITQLLAIHEGTGSSSQGDFFYEYHVARGHFILADKLSSNMAVGTLRFISYAVYLIARSIVRSVRYRKIIPIKAFFKALPFQN